MRRATAALLGTVAGTALLVGAKYGTSPAAGAGVSNTAALADPAAGSGRGAGTVGATATSTATPTAAPTTVPTPAKIEAGKPAAPAPAAPACTTATGNAVNVSKPAVGAVTVTIKVCGGTLNTASGTLSQSNWSNNTRAIPALNTMAVQYYKTGFSQIHYSGASLTSAAYQASLKSAMTRAGI